MISRQRAFLPPPGAARPEWWIISEVARRMGFAEAFSYASPAEIFAEHSALSAFENERGRDFDIGALSSIDAAGFEAMEPFQWPRSTGHAPGARRFFGAGGFYTPDRRARFVPVKAEAVERTSPAFPLILNTGRVRDHWHTMTRTGKSPRLSQHLAEPYAEIHPLDAARYGIEDANLVRVASPCGSILVRALVSSRQAPGSLFVPMHWTDQVSARARVDRLVPSLVDPTSGQPASKHVAVRIERFQVATYGFAVLRRKPERLSSEYWALAKCEGGWRVELAYAEDSHDWTGIAENLFAGPPGAETIAYGDHHAGQHRFACFDGNELVGALFLAREPVAVSRTWAVGQLIAPSAKQRFRQAVMAGRPGKGETDRGQTICVCFGIGAHEIAAAAVRGCRTVAAIGAALQAGTNCGSCRSEIRAIIEAHELEAAE
jgi:assimilatory nitrate reductase catalytic subunit